MFDRKTKWRFQEPGEDEWGDWQRNYAPIADHTEIAARSSRKKTSLLAMPMAEHLLQHGSDATESAASNANARVIDRTDGQCSSRARTLDHGPRPCIHPFYSVGVPLRP